MLVVGVVVVVVDDVVVVEVEVVVVDAVVEVVLARVVDVELEVVLVLVDDELVGTVSGGPSSSPPPSANQISRPAATTMATTSATTATVPHRPPAPPDGPGDGAGGTGPGPGGTTGGMALVGSPGSAPLPVTGTGWVGSSSEGGGSSVTGRCYGTTRCSRHRRRAAGAAPAALLPVGADVELEPDRLPGGGDVDAPPLGEVVQDQEPPSVRRRRRVLPHRRPLRAGVGHLHPDAARESPDGELGGRARVQHGVHHELADQEPHDLAGLVEPPCGEDHFGVAAGRRRAPELRWERGTFAHDD